MSLAMSVEEEPPTNATVPADDPAAADATVPADDTAPAEEETATEQEPPAKKPRRRSNPFYTAARQLEYSELMQLSRTDLVARVMKLQSERARLYKRLADAAAVALGNKVARKKPTSKPRPAPAPKLKSHCPRREAALSAA